LQKPQWRQGASLVAWNTTKNIQVTIPLAGTLNTLRQISFIAIQNDGLDYFAQSDGKSYSPLKMRRLYPSPWASA
jgi:hypothetical protein